MYRHLARQTVKLGQFRGYVAALKEFNALTSSVGLPQYRAWGAAFGGFNEVFTEADYDSLQAYVEAWGEANKNEQFMEAFRKLASYLNEGQDWPLKPIEL